MSHYSSIPEEMYFQTPTEMDSGNCQQNGQWQLSTKWAVAIVNKMDSGNCQPIKNT
jgi:hypothetical protein